jgi:hypothetical protein
VDQLQKVTIYLCDARHVCKQKGVTFSTCQALAAWHVQDCVLSRIVTFTYKIQPVPRVTSDPLITMRCFMLSYFYTVWGINIFWLCWHHISLWKVLNMWIMSGHFSIIASYTSFIILQWWLFGMCCWNEMVVLCTFFIHIIEYKYLWWKHSSLKSTQVHCRFMWMKRLYFFTGTAENYRGWTK